MLVTLKNILKLAEARGIAIGAFNTPNFDSLKAVITAAEEINQPVIVMHAQIHEELGFCEMEEIAPLMIFMAKRAKVPVCVHLDHGTDMDYIKRGLALGFTSVMYDGSMESLGVNIANTSMIVDEAARYGASVEAEVGSMGSREGGGEAGASVFTEPGLALDFVKQTGIDALACAFGTAHGIYREKPKLDFERVRRIHSLIDVPIVMHGGSGVSDEDYLMVIDCGVRKINYYTYMAKAGGEALAKIKDNVFYHDITTTVQSAMKENAMHAIKIFSNK